MAPVRLVGEFRTLAEGNAALASIHTSGPSATVDNFNLSLDHRKPNTSTRVRYRQNADEHSIDVDNPNGTI